MSKWKPYYSACLLVCGAFVLTPAVAAVDGQHQVHKPASRTASASVHQQHGVQVAIDPATGRLRAPTAADRKALSKVVQRDRALQAARPGMDRPQTEAQAKATLRTSSRGQVGAMMQVPESHMNYLTVERRADGSLSVHHQGDKASDTVEEALK